jgi:putative ABC transport system permease protein
MLRHALRRLRRSPAFTITAVLLLALSIAAAASIGGLLEAVLLRPLPFRDADRLVWIWASRVDRDKAFFSVPEFLDHIAATRGADLVACAQWDTTLSGGGEPERVQGARMAASGMTVLGFNPAAGRVFDSSDEQRRVVVLSHDLWRRRFGADPRALGQTLTLNGDPYEIVGVLPADWVLPNFDAQVWVPFDLRADPRRAQRGNNFIRAFGRLRPGATRQSLQAELEATQQRLKAEYAEAVKTAPPRVYAIADELIGAVRRPMWLLAGGVALLVLAASANLAGLMLARGASRREEFAIRAALGARPLQLASEVLLETALVAVVGGVLGVGLANWVIAALVRLGPRDLPRAPHAGVDSWVAAGALVVSALVALAAALPPALHAGQGDAREALAVTGTGSRTTARARRAAVLIEMALTGLLLTVAGLLGHGFVRLQGTEPGFRPQGVLIARISLPRDGYANAAEVQRFAERLLSRLRGLPSAQQAGIGQVLPLTGLNVRADFAVVGRPPLSATDAPAGQIRWSSPGWIATLGIPLLSGRDFDAGDDARGRNVAIADAALVRKYLGGLDPLGTHLVFDDGRDVEIVGVVGEVRHFALDEQPLPTLYMPVAQLAPDVVPYFTSRSFVALRAPGLPPSALREAIREVDASVPADVRAFDEVVGAALAPRRFQTLVMGLFAGAALLLAATGLYGLLAWSVMQRRREIGVRLALGATADRVVRMVVGEGLRLSLAGLAVGALLSAGVARALPAIVPGIVGGDALSFIAAPLLLIAVALASSWIAARRAGAVDPMQALRTG